MINQSCNNTTLSASPADGRPILLLSCLVPEPLTSKKILNVSNTAKQFNRRTEFIAARSDWAIFMSSSYFPSKQGLGHSNTNSSSFVCEPSKSRLSMDL
jgi:hypothetical protein